MSDDPDRRNRNRNPQHEGERPQGNRGVARRRGQLNRQINQLAEQLAREEEPEDPVQAEINRQRKIHAEERNDQVKNREELLEDMRFISQRNRLDQDVLTSNFQNAQFHFMNDRKYTFPGPTRNIIEAFDQYKGPDLYLFDWRTKSNLLLIIVVCTLLFLSMFDVTLLLGFLISCINLKTFKNLTQQAFYYIFIFIYFIFINQFILLQCLIIFYFQIYILKRVDCRLHYIMVRDDQSYAEIQHDVRSMNAQDYFGTTVRYSAFSQTYLYNIRCYVEYRRLGHICPYTPLPSQGVFYIDPSIIFLNFIKVDMLRDEIRTFNQTVRADVNCVQTMRHLAGRTEVKLEDALSRCMALIKRIDNINLNVTQDTLEASNSLVSAIYSLSQSQPVEQLMQGFHLGDVQTHSRRSTYERVYLYGYVVGSMGIPVKDYLDLGIRETRPGKVKLFIENTSNKDNYLLTGAMAILDNNYVAEKFGTFKFYRSGLLEVPHHVLRRLPLYMPGYVPPMPDPRNRRNCLQGFLKRLCRVDAKIDLHNTDTRMLRDLRSFVRSYLRHNFKPLPPLENCTFEEWLSKCGNYNGKRKEELRVAFEGMKLSHKTYRKGKLFCKTEHYEEYKAPRLICPLSDETKIDMGPFAKALEELIYANETMDNVKFIKHIPVRDRAAFLQENLEKIGRKYLGTDYSSFECSFTPRVLKTIELQLYRYMFRNFPKVVEIFEKIAETNHMRSEGLTFSINGRRMSGDMITSVGNGWTNKMIIMFLCHSQQANLLFGVVEGDDGVYSISGNFDMKQCEKMGFEVKQVTSRTVGEAGFCTIYFEPHTRIQVKDIMDTIGRIGWTHSSASLNAGPKRMKELLRAKAASLLYEVPGCPVLTELAMTILRLTPDVNPRFEEDKWWNEQVFQGAMTDEIPADIQSRIDNLREGKLNSVREFVSDKYGITPDMQIRLETYLREMTKLGPLTGPFETLFKSNLTPQILQWNHFAEMHAHVIPAGSVW